MRAILLATTAVFVISSAAWAAPASDNAANSNQSNMKAQTTEHRGNGVSNTTGSQNGSDSYVNVPSTDDLSSKIVGLDIYNKNNKDIGTIKDIALNPNGREAAYIVSVGGFLGMGEHYVAVNPQAVDVSYKDHKWHAKMDATAGQLKSAPEFKYAGRWASNKT